MRLPKVQRAAIDLSLRLARVPVDVAIDLVPESGARPRAAARRAIDAVDSWTRSLLGLTSEDREMRDPPSGPPPPAASQRPARPRQGATQTPVPPAPRRGAAPAQRPTPTPVPPAPRRPAAPPSHEEIAALAFEFYEHGVPGDAESHWQAAERELSATPDP